MERGWEKVKLLRNHLIKGPLAKPLAMAETAHKILEAFAKDGTPAAKAVAELLQNPGKESAERLLKDLPTLLPKDPDLAAVIADAMAAEFAAVLGSSKPAPDGEEITQETAEEIYREMMSK